MRRFSLAEWAAIAGVFAIVGLIALDLVLVED